MFVISFCLIVAWNFNSFLKSLDQILSAFLKFAMLMPSQHTEPSLVSTQLLIFLIPPRLLIACSYLPPSFLPFAPLNPTHFLLVTRIFLSLQYLIHHLWFYHQPCWPFSSLCVFLCSSVRCSIILSQARFASVLMTVNSLCSLRNWGKKNIPNSELLPSFTWNSCFQDSSSGTDGYGPLTGQRAFHWAAAAACQMLLLFSSHWVDLICSLSWDWITLM